MRMRLATDSCAASIGTCHYPGRIAGSAFGANGGRIQRSQLAGVLVDPELEDPARPVVSSKYSALFAGAILRNEGVEQPGLVEEEAPQSKGDAVDTCMPLTVEHGTENFGWLARCSEEMILKTEMLCEFWLATKRKRESFEVTPPIGSEGKMPVIKSAFSLNGEPAIGVRVVPVKLKAKMSGLWPASPPGATLGMVLRCDVVHHVHIGAVCGQNHVNGVLGPRAR